MAPLYDGVTLHLGGEDYIVPPLTFRQLRTLLPQLTRLQASGSMLDAAQLDTVVDLTAAALGRNYPALTRDEIEDRLTFADIPAVIAAILTGSGLARPPESCRLGE